jgi:hypothetical protein
MGKSSEVKPIVSECFQVPLPTRFRHLSEIVLALGGGSAWIRYEM